MKPYFSEKGITVYHADWREVPQELLQADLLLSDPPFGIGEAAGKNKSRTNKAVAKDYGDLSWDNEAPSDFDLLQLRGLTKWQILWGGNYFVLPSSKCWLVWDKVNTGDFADCELAWTNLDKAVRIFRYTWNGMIQEQPEQRLWCAQKPRALMKWCITQAPKTVKTVLDPFSGSGTTGVACKALGLQCTLIEREERGCEIAVHRLEQEIFDFASVEQSNPDSGLFDELKVEEECIPNTTTQ